MNIRLKTRENTTRVAQKERLRMKGRQRDRERKGVSERGGERGERKREEGEGGS